MKTLNNLTAKAGLYNELITSTDLPLNNERTINDIQLIYDRFGPDSLNNYRETISLIAAQCPQQGGHSVYRARFFEALFNDSIEYDDLNVCLNQGYYREMNSSGLPTTEGQLVVVPNPTSGKVTLNIEGVNCKINIVRIIDTFGKLVRQIKLSNPTLTYELQLIDNPSGLYNIEAICDSGVVYHSKLLVVK
ncbi:MAG: T9SS type A sorting domain-containing protein [Bacteroidia bacterium]